jgi:hypothetical protein
MSSSTGGLELPQHSFRSVHHAATEVREAAILTGADPLYLVPFNRYDPEDTYWWLSPEPDNPAFKYGKIVLAGGDGAAPGDLYVGLVFEKGIGLTAAELFAQSARGRRWLVDRTWAWERTLLPMLRSGSFADASIAAESAAGLPLTVFIDAAYAQPPRDWDDASDVHGMEWPRDVVRFDCSGAMLTLIDAVLPADLLGAMAEAGTFSEIATVLADMPKVDWTWIDFHIGLRLARTAAPDAAGWSAQDVWHRACAPWARMIR